MKLKLNFCFNVGGQSASRQSEKAAFPSVKSSSAGNHSALSGKSNDNFVTRIHGAVCVVT